MAAVDDASKKRKREEEEESEEERKKAKKPVRVWLDGCYDLLHFGHSNALRQAKELGDVLVAGIHPTSEIEKHKGLPLMNDEERLEVLKANKWVDEIVTDAPYLTSVDFLKKHNIDFCAHGEDITILDDGRDSFHEVKEAGMFKLIKRTDGVSTTALLGRMLSMSKSHHSKTGGGESSNFLASTRKIVQFASRRAIKPGYKVVYAAGAFDLMHAGHVNFLKQARELGDFLIVGVWGDADVNARMGGNYPIMNTNERVLNALCLKYVDEVIIAPPYHITSEMLASMKVDLVVRGTSPQVLLPDEPDPFRLPKEKGIYKELQSKFELSTGQIIARIIERRLEFEKKKALSEKKAESQKKTCTVIPDEVDKNAE
uniref:ethanolamine-phosphate cytidylyltransferase n=1 Tax=Paramoeba aestuarina TaxID=180227 RepID=A0A7S4NFN7_9EUKA